MLLDELGCDDRYIDSDVNWVLFLSTDAVIDATIKEGESRVRIRAYLLNGDGDDPTDDEVLAWVEEQPQTGFGHRSGVH
ncbi:hypothetical protein ACPPVQ_13695 [Diaminobutyricibacter sp. McL0618]|uniref:hypothetical protein n=1 Tax=Leifsonia sp. McL0618 TaxID=3415677 RepID=UPI003CED0F47